MSRMPGVRWWPLPENDYQSRIAPVQVILHTAVDAPGPTRLERYFARVDVTVESHFWVTLDGTITQMMDTNVRADANRFANQSAISVETEDEGDPEGVPWTPKQLGALRAIILWAHNEHRIPIQTCMSPVAPGIGYHSMWGAPSPWTPAAGKTCPGATRIAQFADVLMPSLLQSARTIMGLRAEILACYMAGGRKSPPSYDEVAAWVDDCVSKQARNIDLEPTFRYIMWAVRQESKNE